jgi:hypothetical protein
MGAAEFFAKDTAKNGRKTDDDGQAEVKKKETSRAAKSLSSREKRGAGANAKMGTGIPTLKDWRGPNRGGQAAEAFPPGGKKT